MRETNYRVMRKENPLDRYISSRAAHPRACLPSSADKGTQPASHYSRIISPDRTKLLRFHSKSVSRFPHETVSQFILKSLRKKFDGKSLEVLHTRKADRILDAPDVINNFYFNPLDWCSDSSARAAVALSHEAYLLGAGRQIEEISRYSSTNISCVKFLHNEPTNFLFLGDETGRVEFYDTIKSCLARNMNLHYNRVGVIENSQGTLGLNTFFTGSKDQTIKLNDLRLKKPDVETFHKHSGEICGLAIQNQYLASGGNDNKIFVWDIRKSQSLAVLKHHHSAVKAISWCPWRSCVLASGGGAKDQKIVIWNGNSSRIEDTFELKSQVSFIKWREGDKSMISTHFNGKESYIIVWEGKEKRVKLRGHKGRILGFSVNPANNYEACSIAADETLRFWSTQLSDADLSPGEQLSTQQSSNINSSHKSAVSSMSSLLLSCDFR